VKAKYTQKKVAGDSPFCSRSEEKELLVEKGYNTGGGVGAKKRKNEKVKRGDKVCKNFLEKIMKWGGKKEEKSIEKRWSIKSLLDFENMQGEPSSGGGRTIREKSMMKRRKSTKVKLPA